MPSLTQNKEGGEKCFDKEHSHRLEVSFRMDGYGQRMASKRWDEPLIYDMKINSGGLCSDVAAPSQP